MMLPVCKRYQKFLVHELRYAWRSLTRPTRVRINGVLIRTDRPHVSAALRRSLYREIYEISEMKIVRAHLDAKDIVLEVGAGLGAIATLCAQRLGDGSRVHSFEANPAMEMVIRETFHENCVDPDLTMGIVSDRDGRQEFFVEETFFSSSSICRSRNARRIEVPSFDLQRLIREIRPTFLIVDAEGHEQVLFQNLELDQVSKVCLELHPDIIGNAACSAVLAQIFAQGFVANFDECEGPIVYLERAPLAEKEAGRWPSCGREGGGMSEKPSLEPLSQLESGDSEVSSQDESARRRRVGAIG